MNKLTFTNEIKPLPDSFPYQSFDDIPIYEQRYLPRWVTDRKAYYRIKEKPEVIRTHIKDLNPTGACLHATENLHAGQKIEIKIFLTKKVAFTISGIVLWKLTQGERDHSAGILFDPLPQETQSVLFEHAFEQ